MSVILANGQAHEVGDQPFLVIVHNNDIKVTVPDSLLVSCFETIKMADSLNDKQWTHISTGPLFQRYFKLAFQEDTKIPETSQDLKNANEGIKHITGMIIMLVENSPLFTKNTISRIFLKNPETFLHPKQERLIVDLVRAIRHDLYGHTDTAPES